MLTGSCSESGVVWSIQWVTRLLKHGDYVVVEGTGHDGHGDKDYSDRLCGCANSDW